jgi:hypothetical protein
MMPEALSVGHADYPSIDTDEFADAIGMSIAHAPR